MSPPPNCEHGAQRITVSARSLRAYIGRNTVKNRKIFIWAVMVLCSRSLNNLESAQVILISGPAGSGKSAIAKDVLRTHP